MHLRRTHSKICMSIIPGGFLYRSLLLLFYEALSSPHMCLFSICTFSPPLYASIWLKFWPSWVAWLLCLCPTFPLVRLGHKGSTSAIVTAGSSGCVPQTGWSRKLVFLREYSVSELKMFFAFTPLWTPRSYTNRGAHTTIRTCALTACTPRERNP